MPADDPWAAQRKLLGGFIRTQRQLANLSLRDLASRTSVSNPYLSQIERGLHEPSVRVLRAIALALGLSAETLLAEAGLIEGDAADAVDAVDRKVSDTVTAIRGDPGLTDAQKRALLAVYGSYLGENAEGS
jgi:transcriptional regulator with XRE-family HTH domain